MQFGIVVFSDHTHFFNTHPFFFDSAKEWDMGYHAISRTNHISHVEY